MTQLPWDADTRVEHFHAIPIPRRSQKCLEDGFRLRLLSKDGQLGNLLCFISFPEFSPGLLSEQKNPPLPPGLPHMDSSSRRCPAELPHPLYLCKHNACIQEGSYGNTALANLPPSAGFCLLILLLPTCHRQLTWIFCKHIPMFWES